MSNVKVKDTLYIKDIGWMKVVKGTIVFIHKSAYVIELTTGGLIIATADDFINQNKLELEYTNQIKAQDIRDKIRELTEELKGLI